MGMHFNSFMSSMYRVYRFRYISQTKPALQPMNALQKTLCSGIIFSMLSNSPAMAQTKKGASLQDVPISVTAITADQLGDLGSWQGDLSSNLGISFGGTRANGMRLTRTSGQALDIRGIGAPIAPNVILTGGLSLSNQVNKIEVLQGPTGTLFGANATAGVLHKLDFIDNTVYGGATIGYGVNTDKEKTDQETTKSTEHVFEYGLQAGKFTDVVGAIVYTGIEYKREHTSFDGGNNRCSTIGINAGLIGATSCIEFDPLHKDHGPGYSSGKTDKNVAFVEGDSEFRFNTGRQTETVGEGSQSFEFVSTKSWFNLNAAGGFYLLDDLAGLGGIQYHRDGRSPKDSDDSQSSSEFAITLGAQAHLSLFGAENFQNAFVSLQGQFGTRGFTSDFGGQSISGSDGFSRLGLTAGVNHHITNSLFVIPNISFWTNSAGISGVNGSNVMLGLRLRQNINVFSNSDG